MVEQLKMYVAVAPSKGNVPMVYRQATMSDPSGRIGYYNHYICPETMDAEINGERRTGSLIFCPSCNPIGWIYYVQTKEDKPKILGGTELIIGKVVYDSLKMGESPKSLNGMEHDIYVVQKHVTGPSMPGGGGSCQGTLLFVADLNPDEILHVCGVDPRYSLY